jgi:hypothetical protein
MDTKDWKDLFANLQASGEKEGKEIVKIST